MPRTPEVLLSRLQEAGRQRPGAREALRRITAVALLRLDDAPRVIRLHEALLFLRAYPHDARVLAAAERALATFEKRTARLAASGDDLAAFDAPEVAGVAGTVIGTDFSFDLVRWLLRRHPRSVRIDWDACDAGDRMRATWPEFLPLLEEEALADANVPYREWLAAAAGKAIQDPGWIVPRYEALPFSPPERAERWDALGAPVSWALAGSKASRTKMRRPGPARFFHDAPLLARRGVALDRVFAEPRLSIRRLSRAEGERVCDLAREATAARYREFYTFTYADPTSVIAARPGRGVEIFLLGIAPERRLPLRAAYGGFIVKNGVPIGYIEGLAFLDRLEIGFNLYYTFRDGESAWIYAQVLRAHRDALGVTSFSVDPYQLGAGNEEAVESGAFWFYRKLGFRPTHAAVSRLAEREEREIAADSSHRSSARTLRLLATHNVLYETPGSPHGDWDRFHIRRIGLAVNRRMRREFGGDPQRIRAASQRRVGRVLGIHPAALPRLAQNAFAELALVLDLIPGLSGWSRAERDGVADIVRAKAGRSERGYLRLLQRHARLRRALIRMGSGD
ncbi:MAG: hypothetical protein ABI968_08820 [Acidobacteriota bacterium]